MKAQRIVYWISTILFCAIMLYSAGLYFLNYEMIEGAFKHLGYPSYLIYPLAAAKILGVGMILWRYSRWLTDWAYAAFFFELILAAMAHHFVGEAATFPLVALLLLIISFFFGKAVRY